MTYSKALANKYATNRDRYRSSDDFLTPFFIRVGMKGKTILDFGCGDGSEAERFISQGAKKVVGIDTSSEMIKLAKKRKLKKSAFFKNNESLSILKDGQFDLVYSRFVLHYIENLEAQFINIARVLKKSGHFLAIFQCLTDDPKLVNKQILVTLGRGKMSTKIKILAKSPEEVKTAIIGAKLRILKFIEVKNTDAHISFRLKSQFKLRNKTYIVLARKD